MNSAGEVFGERETLKLGIAGPRVVNRSGEWRDTRGRGPERNGARPKGEMTTRVLSVKAGSEDEDVTACVLLLRGVMRTNDASAGEMVMTGAVMAGALDDGEVPAVKDSAAET